ncbi:MAG: hypothetical protein ACREMM_11830 [Gemmatimonadales bacterium]
MVIPDLKLDALQEWARLEGRLAARPAPLGARTPVARRALGLVAKLLLFAVLPFLILVRASVFWYSHVRSPTWLALVVGVCCMLVVVTLYAAWLSQRLTGRARVLALSRRVALPLVLAYCAYALLYVSTLNAKSERVREYYTSLHPLLRVALSTWILIDRDIVITDAARRPEDYAGMGLPANDGTLHYRQRDGYTHAADVRTVGRGEAKNRLVQLYFWSMGFYTLRHVGSADHLHVGLPVR